MKRKNKDKSLPKDEPKKIKNSNNPKSSKKSCAYMALIIIICIVVAAIGIVNTICIFASLDKITNSDGNSTNLSLVSTGISIIGIAIAVWAGLNIVNALERKDVEQVAKYVNDLDEQVEKIADKTKGIENREEEQREFDKATLLNYMYSTEEDEATNFFIKKIQELKEPTVISFLPLAELEQHFKSVYEMHRSEYSDNSNLKREASLGIKCAKKLLNNPVYKDVYEYLKYRIAEFHFYSGYCTKEQKRLHHYEAAIKIYEELGSYFEVDIPPFDSNTVYSDIEYRGCDADEYISAYMCNSIGEAYSKIVEIKKKLINIKALDKIKAEEYGLKAVFYCAYANHWVKKSVYKRNYACAIERHYGFSEPHYEILCYEFLQALHMDALEISNFKNIVSIYDKHINLLLEINFASPVKKREPSLDSDEFAKHLIKIDAKGNEDIKKTLSELHKLALQTKTIYPKECVGYQYECIYFRDMCTVFGNYKLENNKDYIVKAKENAQKYLNLAEENWEYLNLVAPFDPDDPDVNKMTQILRNDLNDLKNLL